jgi:sortase A
VDSSETLRWQLPSGLRWRTVAGWVEISLLAVSIACLTYVTWTRADTARFARQAETELTAQTTIDRPPPAPGAPNRARALAAAGAALGRIEISSVGVAAFMAEGDDIATLRHAVGHVTGTAFPGEGGNVGLAGHRDTFFRGLEKLAIGASIRLTTADGIFDYRVATLEVVAPDRVDVLNPTPTSTLTLVTCYPFDYVGPAPQRYIVTAVQTTPRIGVASGSPAGPG